MKGKDVQTMREKLAKSRLISEEIINAGFLHRLYQVLEVKNLLLASWSKFIPRK